MKYSLRKFLFAALSALLVLPASAQNFVDALSLYTAGDYEKAKAQFLAVIALDENDDASYYYAGMCDVMLKEAAEAELFLTKAAGMDPDNYWYNKSLADLYIRTNHPEKAIEIYEKLIADHPKNTELYYNVVNLYARQGDADKVLEKLDDIEAMTGKSESVVLARYDVLMNRNKPDEAFKELESYNEDFSSPQVLCTMGDHQLSMDCDSLALKYYSEALELESSYVPAILGKADVFRLSQDYDSFFDQVDIFVADPESQPQMKIQYLSALVQSLTPDQYEKYSSRLDSLMRTCLSLHPEDYATRVFYAQFLAYVEDWYELIDQAEEAYLIFPEEKAFLEMKNTAYYNLGDYDSLIRECERIISVCAPADSSIILSSYATIGDSYHLLGDRKKAYSAYDKALKINPAYVPVLNNYAYYLSEEGKNLKKAYKMSKITVEAEPDNATYLDTFGWILFLQGKALEAKPFFKHAMLYGGKDSAVILKHYAQVLRALGEKDLANVYEKMAAGKQ